MSRWALRRLIFIFLVLTIHNLLLTAASAQQRDYFTPEEIDLIREEQQIDRRMEVLTKAIDRRFAALKIEVGSAKFTAKDAERWGTLPESTRFQLLFDIRRIMQKAIDDIDSLAERPTSMVIEEPERGKKPKSYADLFPKAMRTLAAAAQRYQNPLKTELDKTTDPAEKGSILDSLDMCSQILEAVKKL